ncbi:Mov34/MPN/PAD-1 family protein [Curtobacterium sp. VKM Ac-2865]|uniref:Mov34/MPN/PAD-1 family protein n=1 Tax=Curtobacterium sp. VKM Ac-2865 TaxID=2783817 RepID=UPI00188AA869|nr:Mov34/MPN/PAD-1 family protein [Curtobacterium sp. VKM Ac-2865]
MFSRKLTLSLPSLRIERSAYDSILHESAVSPVGIETGGILLGHDTGTEILITFAGDPGPKAFQAPNRFLRDGEHASALAASAWDHDRSLWIGEWHTHPRSALEPSAVDLRTYRKHTNDPDLSFERFVSIIVRPRNAGSSLVGWVIDEALYRVPLEIACGER